MKYYIGEIKTSKELGVKDTHKWMWTSCSICNKEKWTRINKGIPISNKCSKCGQVGRPPKDYIGITTLDCKDCKQSLPLSEFYKHNKANRGHQYICKRCSSIKSKQYGSTEHGKLIKNKIGERFRQTEKGKITTKICRDRFRASSSGKRSVEKYEKSDKRKQSNARRFEANREISLDTTTKVCSNCKRVLPLTGFFKNEWGKFGRKSKCKECTMFVLTAYENSEHGKKVMATWIKTDGGKAAMARRSHRRRSAEKSVVATLTAEEWETIKKRYKYRCVYCGENKPLTRDHIIPVSQKGPLTKENIVPACRSCNAKKHTKRVLLQILAMDKPTEYFYIV